MESKGLTPLFFFHGSPLDFRHQELESVLKGRLHQAVSLAQLGEADRWPKIKGLAEDVLQQLGGRNVSKFLHGTWAQVPS